MQPDPPSRLFDKTQPHAFNDGISAFKILDSIPDGIISVDNDWSITYLNQAAQDIANALIKYPGILTGENLWNLFPPQTVNSLPASFLKKALSEKTHVTFELMIKEEFKFFSVQALPMQENGLAITLRDITKEKIAEKESQRLQGESRSRMMELDTLLSVLPIGIGIAMDKDCQVIRSNPALSQMLGLQKHANASLTADNDDRPSNFRVIDEHGNAIPPDQLPMQAAAREGRKIDALEVTVERSDGHNIRLLEYVAPLFNDDGTTRGSVGAFIDITERRQSEDRRNFLTSLDEAIRPLTAADKIMSIATRLLGEYLHVNRCAYATMAEDEDHMHIAGDHCRGVPSMVGYFSFTQFGQEVLRLMRANEPYVVHDIESHVPPPEDIATYHQTQIRAVICVPLYKGDRFVGAMAVHQKTVRHWTDAEVALVLEVANRCWESMERAKIALALSESDERFRLLADHMAQMAWMADADGSVFWYNRRWFEYTGSSLYETIGLFGEDIHHPNHLGRVIRKWQEHVLTQEIWEDTFPMLGKDGKYRWFLARALPVRSEKGQVLRWFGTHTDVTDQMQITTALAKAKEEAEQANQTKDEFLAVLSHELRTPLTPVLLSVADLEENKQFDASVREELAMIRRNIELEARLIDDLLDVTRISRGIMSLRLEGCNMHRIVRLVTGILMDDIQEKHIAFSCDLKAEQTYMQGDPARLQQVIWNILKNAIKFTPARGNITITTYNNEDNQIVVDIRDTGIGINSDAVERIFRPFEQGGLANDHRFGGLGLGLSISQAIVDMHGGSIKASSPGAGLGSTFRVTLPLSKEVPSEHPLTNDGPTALHQQPGGHVLLVEDHEPTLKALSRLLRKEGYEVTTASRVADAQTIISQQGVSFDLVISDIGLPDGNGHDLMKALCAIKQIPGIALTGYGTEEDQLRAREAGFTLHLTKPVNISQLRQALLKCLKAQ